MTVAHKATFSPVWRGVSAGVAPALALLLAVLTPIGTGKGVHSDQLLDLVFPHVHLLSGVVIPQGRGQRNVARGPVEPPKGQALGASAGAAETGLSEGFTPTVSSLVAVLPRADLLRHLVSPTLAPAGADADPPPDPPPIAAYRPSDTS